MTLPHEVPYLLFIALKPQSLNSLSMALHHMALCNFWKFVSILARYLQSHDEFNDVKNFLASIPSELTVLLFLLSPWPLLFFLQDLAQVAISLWKFSLVLLGYSHIIPEHFATLLWKDLSQRRVFTCLPDSFPSRLWAYFKWRFLSFLLSAPSILGAQKFVECVSE